MNFNSEVNFGDLIKVLGGGLKVSTYPQIVEMLKTRYQEIYGSDINVDPTTADGTWIHDIALLINNILQGMQTLYANMDVNTASGVFLDNLCQLSNVTRKSATSSTARVQIRNIGNASVTLAGVTCIDTNGLTWSSPETINLAPSESINVNLSCDQTGSIEAPNGSITQVVNIQSNVLLSCTQVGDAVVGTETETDAELRARRNDSNSPIGITTIDSLVGALLNIAGVQDCVIVENKSQSTMTTYDGDDGTDIGSHSIYVVLRTQGTYNEDKVADTIYQKLTAGIGTNKSGHDNGGGWQDGAHGTGKSKDYYPQIYGIDNTTFYTTIYWKQATPVNPEIEITLDEKRYFSSNNVAEIGKGLIDYLNALHLNKSITKSEIADVVAELDPQFKGTSTYSVANVDIDAVLVGDNDTYYNQLTYYNYTQVSAYNTSTHKFTIS